MIFTLVLFLLIAIQSFQFTPTIIIIPGFEGTRLYATLNRTRTNYLFCHKTSAPYEIWIDHFSQIFTRNCFLENFRLIYDKDSNQFINQEGVDISLMYNFGSLDSVLNLHKVGWFRRGYADALIDHLLSRDFIPSKNLFFAGYDFRKIGDSREMDKYFTQVQTLITKLAVNDPSKIMFLSIGIGGPLVSNFLKAQKTDWIKKHIDSWYSISGTFLGSFVPLQNHLTGLEPSFFSPILTQRELKSLYSTFPTTYFMFPSPKLFNLENINLEKSISSLLDNIIKNRDTNNITNILSSISKISPLENVPIPMACVYGSGFNTTSNFSSSSSSNSLLYSFSYSVSNGDRFSTMQSLQACGSWKSTSNHPAEMFEIVNTTYLSILNDKRLFRHLDSFIKSRSSNTMPTNRETYINLY